MTDTVQQASRGPRITVVVLIYHGARFVPGLVDVLLRQRHPRFDRQADWLQVLIMDNGSTDDTGAAISAEMAKAGAPAHFRVVTNPKNLGYAGAMNKALSQVTTPFVLTCHCDCLFGSDEYVASMLELLERNEDVAAVTGQPQIPAGQRIPFVEKTNLVAYLMDIFPDTSGRELVPVGFAEGRCDAFRMEALRKAGFYDATHHSAGEDQILSARMREDGWRVCQAPALRYVLSVSDEQDTVGKLIRHMRLFGEKHPILVLRSGAAAGALTGQAGRNRRVRSMLRVNQLFSVAVYAAALAAVPAGIPPTPVLALLAFAFAWKAAIFARHLRAVRFGPAGLLAFFALQVPMDLAYAWGFARGLWLALFRTQGRVREGGGSSPASKSAS